MIATHTPRLAGPTRIAVALLASSAIFFAGCSNTAATAPVVSSSSGVPATLGGHIHGGNQPVSGATVTLYFAGQKPNPATVAATATSAADGSFSFDNAYTCPLPPAASPLVYVVAKGGNTQNNGLTTQSNPAAEFIGVYGTCNAISSSSYIELNEVTTVATMIAVQQFFVPVPVTLPNGNQVPAESLMWDGTGQESNIWPNITNTIALLADTSNGTAVTSQTLNGSGTASGASVTVTPEPGKINLMANILAACINTANGSQTPCQTLFTAAVPPPLGISADSILLDASRDYYPAATDTLQALFYILINPTNGTPANLSNLWQLVGGIGGPYQPSMTTAPTDWTVGVSYTSTSTCGSSGNFISSPTDINIDVTGNVWITNSQGTTGNLSEIAASGKPNTCVFLGDGGTKAGGVVDINGNIWAVTATSIYRYTPGGSSLQFPLTNIGNPTPIEVTSDGLGNVYFSAVSGTTGSVYEIVNGASPSVTTAIDPVQIATGVGSAPTHLLSDYQEVTAKVPVQGNIWVTSGSNYVTEISPSTGTGNLNGFTSQQVSVINGGSNSYGLGVSRNNLIFVSDNTSGAVTSLAFNQGAGQYQQNWSDSDTASAGISNPTAIVVDPLGTTWLANNANGSSGGSISAISAAPTAISPSTGYQKSSSYLSSGRAMAIDQSGNIWVGGDGNNFVTEIIGGAVPLYAPYSLGLYNGRFENLP